MGLPYDLENNHPLNSYDWAGYPWGNHIWSKDQQKNLKFFLANRTCGF